MGLLYGMWVLSCVWVLRGAEVGRYGWLYVLCGGMECGMIRGFLFYVKVDVFVGCLGLSGSLLTLRRLGGFVVWMLGVGCR